MAVVLRPPNQDGGMHEDRVFASIELSGTGLEEVLAIQLDVDVMKARTTEELVSRCENERADPLRVTRTTLDSEYPPVRLPRPGPRSSA